MGIAGYNIR